MAKRTHLLLFLLLYTVQVWAQTKKAKLDTYFAAQAAGGHFNGIILVAEKGKVVYQAAYGHANVEAGIALTGQTPFGIASISKTLTATAILQLAEAGKLDIDKPVQQYLPWFPYAAITSRHLLSHTSGLPPYNVYFDSLRRAQPQQVFTNTQFAAGVAANPQPLLYIPGDRGNYDNINFIVLAILIKQLSGMEYPAYISTHILQPAGMRHTRFLPLRAQYTDSANLPMAHPYLYPHRYQAAAVRASAVPYITSYWSAYNFSGFGDYVSTVHDLLLYDQAYYSGTLLSAAATRRMFTPVLLNNGKPNAARFGLGWQLWADSSLGPVVYHNGNATGLSCVLIRNPARQQTIVVMDNLHGNNAQSLGFAALQLLNGGTVPLPKQSLANIYGRQLVQNGADAARKQLLALKADTSRYYLSEDEMNLLGYDFLGGPNNPNPYQFPEVRKYPEALAAFQLNTELFPTSWNVYDSYGEALAATGHKQEAIQMYTKSIELNPQNEEGKKMLEKLRTPGP